MERWLPVVGYEGAYEISDRGRAQSLDRTIVVERGGVTFERHYKGKTLSHCSGGEGGHHVVILSRQGGPPRRALVHHLVLEAFVEPRPAGMFGLHRDDDPSHNELPNLYWGTKGQNADDKVRNGNHHNAEKKRCPKGHRYDEANTYRSPKGNGRFARRCRKCRNDRLREKRLLTGSAS